MVALTQRPLLKLDAKTYFNCQRTIGLSTARLVAATDARHSLGVTAPDEYFVDDVPTERSELRQRVLEGTDYRWS